jgi:hypothetical protein
MAQDEEKRRPLDEAKDRADRVQEDLRVAGAELGLAHEALERHVPPEAKQGDVAWAIGQNAAVGRKLGEAAEELEEVTELLQEEKVQRKRLEKELKARR